MRQHKVIFLNYYAPLIEESPSGTQRTNDWKPLIYAPDLASSDYHLSVSMGNTLSEQRFDSNKKVTKWLDDLFADRKGQFFGLALTNSLGDGKLCREEYQSF